MCAQHGPCLGGSAPPRNALTCVAALLLAQISPACQAHPNDGDAWRSICDGSQELKLGVRYLGYEGGSTYIARELGRTYLYVRGDCTYWVATSTEPKNPDGFTLGDWQVTHTGTLTAEAEQELSQRLLYARWPELAGHYHTPDNPGLVIEYSDGESTIRCDAACGSWVEAPQVLKDLTPVVSDVLAQLWDQGENHAASAPLRVDLLEATFSGAPPLTDDPCALVWDFALDPAAIARDTSDPPMSHLLVDGAVTSQMRALRDDYLAGLPDGACNYVFQDGALLFYQAASPMTALSLWMRDALPLETPDGVIPFPDPPASP